MIDPRPGTPARSSCRLGFNLLFWLGFWLSPVLVQVMEQWPEVTLVQCLLWLKQGVVFTAGMTAVAEIAGRGRRFFYLAAGLVAWGGAVIATVFLATTGITANAFTALTGVVYSGHDDAGLRYLIFTQQDLLGVVMATCPFLLLLACWRKIDWRASQPAFVLAASICVIVTSVRWIWHDYGPWRDRDANRLATLGMLLDPAPPIAAYLSISRAWPLARSIMLKPGRTPPRVQVPVLQRPLTLVVVVGESTTRNHMGVYGYCRETTPMLDKRAAELFVFLNAVSEIPMTVFALSSGLRVTLDDNHGQPDQSVFDIFNAAGFHTYWLSNQFDYPGDPVSALTRRAGRQIVTYHGKKNGAEHSTLDDTLLAPLDAVLTGDPASKVIFLHTVGTHSFYEERVPDGFLDHVYRDTALNRSSPQKKFIDAYDTAVSYVDRILDQVITRSDSDLNDAVVVYFSDHGDEVFEDIDFVGHRYPRATHDMVEIPLLVWLSPQLRATRPALAAKLGAALSQPLDTRDISPLLIDIAGIGVQGLLEERRPLAVEFRPQQRLVSGYDYDRDPTLGITRQLPALRCIPVEK